MTSLEISLYPPDGDNPASILRLEISRSHCTLTAWGYPPSAGDWNPDKRENCPRLVGKFDRDAARALQSFLRIYLEESE